MAQDTPVTMCSVLVSAALSAQLGQEPLLLCLLHDAQVNDHTRGT